MTRAVLFDLDETLTDRAASIVRYAAELRADFASSLIDASVERIADAIRVADVRGYAPRAELFVALQNGLDWRERVEAEALARHWRLHFPSAAVARPGVAPTLHALRSRGYALGIVTNGRVESQAGKIAALGVQHCFDTVVISEHFGMKKPAPEIFRHAAALLGCACDATWFVGDHPENDVDGARRAGMRAVWLRGVHAWPDALPRPHHAIDAIPDLLALVGA